MTIPDDFLNTLIKGYKNLEDPSGETGLLKQLTKQLLERAAQTETTEHQGYEKNAPSNNKTATPVLAVATRKSKGISVISGL